MRHITLLSCALAASAALASMASALGLDDIETFEQLESMDLFAAAVSAAEADDIPRARTLLEQALGTSGAAQGRAEAERAIAAAEARERERIRAEEETRRLAAEEEERRRQQQQEEAARAATSTRPNTDSPSCATSATIYFNLSGRWEIVHDLQVTGPWYVGKTVSGQQAFLRANGGECVGGQYSYRYTAELDDLLENPVNTYTGSFTIGNQTTHCEVSISPYSGRSDLFCD